MGTDFPESAFKYSFLDDSYDRLHRSEEKTGVLMISFSCLAIFVACESSYFFDLRTFSGNSLLSSP